MTQLALKSNALRVVKQNNGH